MCCGGRLSWPDGAVLRLDAAHGLAWTADHAELEAGPSADFQACYCAGWYACENFCPSDGALRGELEGGNGRESGSPPAPTGNLGERGAICQLVVNHPMPYEFTLHSESIKRKFAVYVVIAKSAHNTRLYVGKTGDNNDGCNPVISRCGNHFSYNDVHSQVRNKLEDHEEREYTYVFDHFDEYHARKDDRRVCVDRINEMERWLNQEIQAVLASKQEVELLNPFQGVGYVPADERARRSAFRTTQCEKKIKAIVASVGAKCG